MLDPLRLLAVFPHPDDETFGLGGAIPSLAASGVEVDLICATLGERGWTGAPEDDPGFEWMARTREVELREAARHLGIREIHLLGYIDGEVEQAPRAEITGRIAAVIRAVRPQVVVTYAPDGIYGHPDHIALSQFTAAAIVLAAAQPGPSGERPHIVAKFYHVVDTETMVDAFQEAAGGIGMQVNGEERRHRPWPEWTVTCRMDTGAFFPQLWRAALSHTSQLPSFGPFVDLPEATRRAIFRYATFVRVYSLVNEGLGVEEDLFDGLR